MIEKEKRWRTIHYIAHAYWMEHAVSARRLCNKAKFFAISGPNRKVNLDMYVFERPTNVVDEQELYYQLNDLIKKGYLSTPRLWL